MMGRNSKPTPQRLGILREVEGELGGLAEELWEELAMAVWIGTVAAVVNKMMIMGAHIEHTYNVGR